MSLEMAKTVLTALNLPDVQPIITILGLKKTGPQSPAYFVTFGALVVLIDFVTKT